MSRSKCARCGKMGHWARDCANEPDERGRKRQAGIGGFQAVPLEADHALRDDCQRGPTILSGVSSDGFGSVDAGAQHGVCCKDQFEEL
eukprot:7635609-Pyramimonas_sp.AAC.1